MREFQATTEQINEAAAAIRARHERIQQDAEQLTTAIREFDLGAGRATIYELDRARAILPQVDLFRGAVAELDEAKDDKETFRAVRRLHSRAQSHLWNADLRGDRHDLEAHRTMVTTIEDAF